MPARPRGLALLLVDFLNPLDFTRDAAFIRRAVCAAAAAARLKAEMKRQHVPVIYTNDHWGHWTQSVPELVQSLSESDAAGKALVNVLAPSPGDYTILKPRHSAFYGTPLLFLLQELGIRSLAIAGIAADNCVFFTASDAYVRRYSVWIPSNCVASENDANRKAALQHMKRVLKAQTHAA